MLVFGGWAGGFTCYSTVYMLDLAALAWTRPATTVAPGVSVQRRFESAAAYDEVTRRFYVYGGT
eukprot:CAMPEP_0198326492 /NCGR_PEP_ID=MMETSP1450-20131203/14006_1 /TAXON_ID=753684 ORGANISM="Madagascaria erythrocladiodes, Strain CCMP3234" /NCGR_SAMPLE_ID=MMETSP1450 /ASSEMBLY_ACC=CAM_ASM_001115 /LENGTH=63 /DNA_ID=CAMNT_0044030457 /DNA_START=1 /DNA_END=188 /DNA_ORIENTATION=+